MVSASCKESEVQQVARAQARLGPCPQFWRGWGPLPLALRLRLLLLGIRQTIVGGMVRAAALLERVGGGVGGSDAVARAVSAAHAMLAL
jgi:hypothetical protein